MKWSDYIRGEWWLLPGGGEEYADQDIGEAGHGLIAIRNMVDADILFPALERHLILIKDSSRATDLVAEVLADPDTWEWAFFSLMEMKAIPDYIGTGAVGGDPKIWDLLKVDVRAAYERVGAIRVINKDFSMWKVTDENISRIQDFLLNQVYEAGDIEAEDVAALTGNTTIEESSTGEYVSLPINDFLAHKHKRDFWETYTSNKLMDLELPKDTKCSTRLEWAGERFGDMAEGKLTPEEGWFIWGAIVGWADLATDNERRQYLAMAGQIEELLKQV
jgi:hypothetical protein